MSRQQKEMAGDYEVIQSLRLGSKVLLIGAASLNLIAARSKLALVFRLNPWYNTKALSFSTI